MEFKRKYVYLGSGDTVPGRWKFVKQTRSGGHAYDSIAICANEVAMCVIIEGKNSVMLDVAERVVGFDREGGYGE